MDAQLAPQTFNYHGSGDFINGAGTVVKNTYYYGE